jgi:hypothetical protein
MAGAFPSSANFETLGLSSIQNTIISKSISGKKLSRQIDNQRFRFTIKIIVGKRSDIYGELMAFIMKQRSSKENFTISPPELKSIRGVESSTVSVNGSHTFAGQTKVYMVVEDVTSSSNAATVTIEPPLRSALADDAVVTYNNINFTVHLTNDVQEFGVVGATKDGDLLYQFELDVEETL